MIENGMLVEKVTPKRRKYCCCDYCNEDIYGGQPITTVFDFVVHQDCFQDFVEENKLDAYAPNL